MAKKTDVPSIRASVSPAEWYRFVPESSLALWVALSVKEMVGAGLDYAENYPVLAEVAHLSQTALFDKLRDQSYSDMLRSEMLDYMDDYRMLGKRTPVRTSFDHFIGNSANTFHMALRNERMRDKFSPVLESLPSLARIMRIVSTKQPKSVYEKIKHESLSRVERKDFSWQAWLGEVRSYLQ